MCTVESQQFPNKKRMSIWTFPKKDYGNDSDLKTMNFREIYWKKGKSREKYEKLTK